MTEAVASLKRLQAYLLLDEHEDPPKSKVVEARFVSGWWARAQVTAAAVASVAIGRASKVADMYSSMRGRRS